MNKNELATEMSLKTGMSKKTTLDFLGAFTDVVSEVLAEGEEISIVGFGKFSVSERSARTGRNPITGDVIEIAACKAPKFKPSKALKDLINE